jgi:hypothetical protein
MSNPKRLKSEQNILEFFLVGLKEHQKMFHQWVSMEDAGLVLLASYSKAPTTGCLFAQWILGLPICANLQMI